MVFYVDMSSGNMYGQDPLQDGLTLSGGRDDLTPIIQYLASSPRENFAARLEGMLPEGRRVIFGEMAMYLAGVTSPDEVNTPEWYHKVLSSLTTLADPAEFARIMDAPYADALAPIPLAKPAEVPEHAPSIDMLESLRPAPTTLDRSERKQYGKTRELTTRHGYFDHSFLPSNRVVQLVYSIPDHEQETAYIAFKLRSIKDKTLGLNIKQYELWSKKDGYKNYIGNRFAYIDGLFEVLAVQHTQAKVDYVKDLPGEYVTFGKLGQDTPLQIKYKFSADTEEVPGYEEDIKGKKLTSDYKLFQAYYGTSWNYPLF